MKLAEGCGFILDDWQRRVLVELRPAPPARRMSAGELIAGAVSVLCCLALFAMGAFLIVQWWELW